MTSPVALLLRRAGFGPTSTALATARKAGYEATVAALTAPSGPDHGAASAPVPRLGRDPYSSMPYPTLEQRATADAVRREQTEVITRWWLDRLTIADHQASEKLLFFWHGHWATSIEKVMSPQLMLRQHLTMRAAPEFITMARNMVQDAALVYWLDGHLNTNVAPNENLARELMELFILGIGQYTEQDVKEAGRALTGWWISLGGEAALFDGTRHDTSSKTILGLAGPFTARSLVDHLMRQDACPRFIAGRLWFRYASSSMPIPRSAEERMVAAFPAPMAMLRAMFQDDAFIDTAGTMVKQPVEWFVGATRQLGLRPRYLSTPDLRYLLNGLRSLGQLPFVPPSVGGWPSGNAWLTSAAAQVRISLAWKLADLAKIGPMSTDALAHVLAIETWSNRTYDALRGIADPKLQLAIGLASPEYLVS